MFAALLTVVLQCPHGYGAWTEYTSSHFYLDTDAPEAVAVAFIRELESMQVRMVKGITGEDREIPGRVRVYAFAEQKGFERVTGLTEASGLYQRNWVGESVIVMTIESGDGRVTLAHEVAHHVARHLFGEQPPWFAQGIAQFAETLGGPGRAMGLLQRPLMRALSIRLIRTGELFVWENSNNDPNGRLHAAAWLLFHFLWNTHQKQLMTFANLIELDWRAAWKEAFPEYAGDAGSQRLDNDLDAYRLSGEFVSRSVEAKTSPRLTKKALNVSELHALQAQLNPSTEQIALAQAREDDPAQAYRIEETENALRKAVALKPWDWRLRSLLASKTNELAEWEAAVRLNPDNVMIRYNLAWTFLESDRPGEAFPHAKAAVVLSPHNHTLTYTLGMTSARLGKCADAKPLFQRAHALAKNRVPERAKIYLAAQEKECPTP